MKLSIREQLEKNNMSRYELAKRLGMAYQSVHNMYKEESTSIKFTTLEALCRELSCDLDDILIFEDPALRQKQLERNYDRNHNYKDNYNGNNDDKDDNGNEENPGGVE